MILLVELFGTTNRFDRNPTGYVRYEGRYNLAVAKEPNQEPNRQGSSGGAPENERDGGFLSSQTRREQRSWLPWISAFVVVVVVLVVLLILGHRSSSSLQPGGAGMAPAASYAPELPIAGLTMSEASSFSGSKVTYVDGQIANTGNKTITAITVQVGFRNDLGQLAQRTVMPLSLIRTREPYVDTQPVSAAPLKPGDHRGFRLIFDSMPPDWNQQFPEIRIIGIEAR